MIALIDYDMGNLFSVRKALESVGAEVEILNDAAELANYEACILPGVGNFGEGMEALERKHFKNALRDFARSGKPLLGICLGMQMFLDRSEEAPGVEGLGLIRGSVRRFPDGTGEKVPHMGWNEVTFRKTTPLCHTHGTDHFYFVHSYYVCPDDPADLVGECEYILPFAALIGRDNVLGAQFHPEKSQSAGLALLSDFVKSITR
ncbi:MAG: imidazole glycerol phosphate synthase subunit HisH [Victivallaceae bacterium]|nr:imidazole glycerol phosphate synthase subunit HisH [Victivallaceae bacterium]